MKRRGSYAIEFALVVPLLVLGLAGTMDLAQYLVLSEAVVEAVAEGARSGAHATEKQDPTVLAATMAQTSWSNTSASGKLTLKPLVTGKAPNKRLVVTGSAVYKPYFGFVKALPAGVNYTSTVRIINQ